MCSIREVSFKRNKSCSPLELRFARSSRLVAHLIDISNNDKNVKKRITRTLVSYSHKSASKYWMYLSLMPQPLTSDKT